MSVSQAGFDMCGGGGAIPHNTYRTPALVVLMHQEMALAGIAFGTGYIFDACDDLPQTGDAYSTEEKHGGTDRSVVCSPVRVRHLLEDDIPDSGFLLWS